MNRHSASKTIGALLTFWCLILQTSSCGPTPAETPSSYPTYTPFPTYTPDMGTPSPLPTTAPTPEALTQIPRCYYPSDAVMTPDGRHIYIPCYATNNLAVVDTPSGRVVDVIDLSPTHPLGLHVYDAAITSDGRKIYLGDDMMDLIAVVSTETNRVKGVIDFGREGAVNAIDISFDGSFALVAWEGGSDLGIIDVPTDTVRGYFVAPEEESFYLVGIGSRGDKAYAVSSMHGGRIYAIDTTSFKVLGRLDLGVEGRLHPQASMAISPDDRFLYLTSGFNEGGMEQPELGTNRLLVVDLESLSLVDEIEIMGGPQRITLTSNGRLAYVSTFSAGKVVLVDLVQRMVVGEFDWGDLFAGQLDFKRYDLRQVVLDPKEERGYLVGWDGGILAGLDLQSLRLTGAIELNPMYGAEPVDILVAPDGQKAYVSTWALYPPHTQNTVAVINLESGEVLKRIPIDGEPMRLALSADGETLYLPTGSSFVAVIDTTTDEVIRTIVPGPEPHFFTDAAVQHDLNKLFVSYASQDGGGGIYAIDLTTENTLADIRVDSRVASLSLSTDGLYLFANRVLDPEGLLVINTASDEIERSVRPPEGTNFPEVGTFTAATAASPDGLHLYWGTGPSFVHILDIGSFKVLRTIRIFNEILTGLPIAPSEIAFSPDGLRAYISCLDAGYMVVWDMTADALIAAIRVGVNPVAVATTPDGELAYVANMLGEDISVIDLGSLEVVNTIPLGP